MAEENKHPPTTEEQAPPEMPGKAPEMEQAEIPDVGGGPTPSAKVIDLSAVRPAPEKDASPDIPKEPEAPPVSVTEYSKQEWEKPMPEPKKPKAKRGRPAKAEKAAPKQPLLVFARPKDRQVIAPYQDKGHDQADGIAEKHLLHHRYTPTGQAHGDLHATKQ